MNRASELEKTVFDVEALMAVFRDPRVVLELEKMENVIGIDICIFYLSPSHNVLDYNNRYRDLYQVLSYGTHSMSWMTSVSSKGFLT